MGKIAESVPYDGVQGITPADGVPNDQITSHANANDFGAQVGQSTEHLGDVVQEQAAKFTQMYSDSSARDGVTQASKALSDAELEFKKNKGNNAVGAYKGFQENVAKIQNQYAASMPNQLARKNFQDDFAREANGAIFRSGAYVANQTEEAQTTSINASIANNVNQFALNADNPTRGTYLTNIQTNALEYAHHMGLDPDTADKLVSHNIGEAYSTAIKTNIQQNPTLAKTLYDEAVNGTMSAERDGKTVSVPYLDAAHRAQITGEMGGEFRRQFADQLSSARSYASLGTDYDKAGLIEAAHNAGHNDAYITAEMARLDGLATKAGQVNTRYSVDKSLDNAKAQAMAGVSLTGIPDEATIRAAYPKEPDKAQDMINEFHDQYHIASFMGALPTTPLSQIDTKLSDFKPATKAPLMPEQTTNNAIKWTMEHEGGFVSNDSGKGPTKYGINAESNPGIDLDKLTPDGASKIMHDKYWLGVGADKMSPQMGAVAFDTAVNMGVTGAKELVEESGGDPQKLIDLRRERYNVLAETNPEKYGKNLDGWNARLDDLQKTLSSSQGADGQSSGFAEQDRTYKKMVAAAQDYAKRLVDDPAATIVGADQNLTNMLNDGLKDPSKLGPYIDAMNARQDLLEVPAANRAVLPANAAASFTAQITDNPKSAPDTLSKLKKQTGSYWPQVYHSLVTQGDLPPNYQAIAHLNDDPTTQKDAFLLAKWLGEDPKGKDTTDLIGGAKAETDIKNNINGNTHVQMLVDSLLQSNQSRDQVKGTLDAIHALAFAKTYYNRDPQAADNAAEAFTSKYEFMTAGNARVPVANYEAVNTNAEDLLDHLVERGAVAPDAYKEDVHGTVMQPADYFAWVKNSPTWVTSPNEDALWLKDPQDGWVFDKTGRHLQVPFNKQAPPKLLTGAQIGER